MGKKMIGIIVAIVVLFGGLFFLISYKNDQVLDGDNNPYGTSDLAQSTIDLIGDPNYDNIVLPEDLSDQVESGEPTTIYFFSPECSYCVQTTPYLAPLAKEMDVDLKQYNVLEFPEDASSYGITATPSVVHYVDGEEVEQRLEGQFDEEQYEAFFNEYVLNE